MFMIERVDEIRHFYQFTVATQSSYPLSHSRSDPAKPQQPMEFLGFLIIGFVIAFFVKYSFEHNLIPPELRIAIGFVVGAVLVVGGLLLKRKENAVTAQTLCATGILVLYAVTFACRAYYHFAFFGLIPTFLLMM